MDLSEFIKTLASQGVLGVMLIVTGYVAWSKDRELREERNARIEDAKDYTELALKLHAQVIDSVHKLASILDEVKKMVPAARR